MERKGEGKGGGDEATRSVYDQSRKRRREDEGRTEVRVHEDQVLEPPRIASTSPLIPTFEVNKKERAHRARKIARDPPHPPQLIPQFNSIWVDVGDLLREPISVTKSPREVVPVGHRETLLFEGGKVVARKGGIGEAHFVGSFEFEGNGRARFLVSGEQGHGRANIERKRVEEGTHYGRVVDLRRKNKRCEVRRRCSRRESSLPSEVLVLDSCLTPPKPFRPIGRIQVSSPPLLVRSKEE